MATAQTLDLQDLEDVGELSLGTGKGIGMGLNTESNNPQRASATWLVELAGGNTAEMNTQYYPG